MRDLIYNEDERQYLQMMQSNIERMANNSANCKTWLVTIVSGFLAIGCGVAALNGWILIGLLPVFLFWYLDVYYLSLERGMRNRQKDFLNKVLSVDEVYKKALYNFAPLPKSVLTQEEIAQGLVKTTGLWWTKSVSPFYPVIIIVVFLITAILNWSFICKWLCHNNTPIV